MSSDRQEKFYGEGLGGTIDKDYPTFVSVSLGDGSSSLALYEREAAAQDAGMSAEGSGFTVSRSTTSSRQESRHYPDNLAVLNLGE